MEQNFYVSLIRAKSVCVHFSSIVTVTCSRAEWLRSSSSFKLTLAEGRQNEAVGATGAQCFRPGGKKMFAVGARDQQQAVVL